MTVRKNLEDRIRGWFPQEPLNPNKQRQIKLENNPLKLKQKTGKLTINLAQFIAVVLAISLILGGLFLNSVSSTKSHYSLPIEYYGRTYPTPFQFNGTNYNYTVYAFITPPLQAVGTGVANDVAPIFMYLNEPCNLTSGVYCVTLRYASYNYTSGSYDPKELNYTGTFSPSQTENQHLIYHAFNLHPPFETGSISLEPIVRDVVLTLYSNSTGKQPSPLFTITTQIDLTHSAFIITYPYRNIGNILLTVGIASLIIVFVLSVVNLGKKTENLQVEKDPRS